MALEAGRRLAHYEIVESIGAGGMGEVYRARDSRLARDVALKVLPEDLSSDPLRVERFQIEARAASALNHPNIVHTYDVGEFAGRHFIAMEYVKGRTLRDILEEGVTAEAAHSFARQTAAGLAKAHAAGIVHRDLKPSNILIDDEGVVKIVDFGLAKMVLDAARGSAGSDVATIARGITAPGVVLGTVGYMSPEQAKGEASDFRSDVFSFGAILYEMLAKRKAFERKTAAESLAAVLNEAPALEPVPPSFRSILERCMAKNASERYRSTKELVEALDGIELESRPEPSLPSIAVLPFVNMSADPEQEYFCDGIAEDIINALNKVKSLRVAARTSAFTFKGANANVREIGDKLDVSYVLEGSVRKAGTRLRITAQLIAAADGYQQWSERFDRELDDIFAIQDEISLAIVEKLEVGPLGAERDALVSRATDRVEVHNLYMLARYHFNRFTLEDTKLAQSYLEKAIALERSYAPAHALLAMVLAQFSSGGVDAIPPQKVIPEARRVAEKALELDRGNSDAFSALAVFDIFHDRDWEQGLVHAQSALSLDANASLARVLHAYCLTAARRHDEAIAEIERGIALDPLAPMMLENAAWHYYHARRYERAREYCERTFTLAPFGWAHFIVGLLDVQTGELTGALRSFERAAASLRFVKGYLAYALAALGETARARELHAAMEADIAAGELSSYLSALFYFGLGETEECLNALEAAVAEKPAMVVALGFLNTDPFWDPLRKHPRFEKMIERMGFPD